MACVEKIPGGGVVVTGAGVWLYGMLVAVKGCELETKFPVHFHGWKMHRRYAKCFGIPGRLTAGVRAQVRERLAAELEKAQNEVNSADFAEARDGEGLN